MMMVQHMVDMKCKFVFYDESHAGSHADENHYKW